MVAKKIAIIGNSCSGKTALSRLLAKRTGLPLFHVDSIQFLPGLKLQDPSITRKKILEITSQASWILDGIGPLNILEQRLLEADRIIFIRIPLWRSYLWCLKRQMGAIIRPRAELPADCFEATPAHTWKLLSHIKNVHNGLWPQLDRIFQGELYRTKLLYLRSVAEIADLASGKLDL